MSRNVAAVEKEILIKNALVATRASYQPPPLGNSSLCHAANPSSSHLLSCIRAVSDAMDINEVYPNVFISDETTARNKTYLVAVGITHVVNAAEGHLIGFVNTSSQFYQGCGISYKGVNLADLAAADASRYFKEVSNFIDNGLKSGGKVLVHCVKGISRSATLVLAFLMMKRDMTAVEAMTTVRHKRNIRPNGGFIHQLAKLDNKLLRKRRKSASPDPSSLSKP